MYSQGLANDLSELLNIEAEIRENITGVTSQKTYAMGGIEDKLKRWLMKVQK